MIILLIHLSSCSFWLGTSLLLVSLAGPERLEKRELYLTSGIDIVFVLDESLSMAVEDYPPMNRFETAKSLIASFVRNRDNDAVGLVSFGREASLRIPPTIDHNYFIRQLESQKLMSLGDGTSVGLGIAIGVIHLQRSSAEEKILIVLTDGENNSGEISPLTAAKVAATTGIRIHAVGIGSRGVNPIEYTDPDSGEQYSGLYRGGFNAEILKEIAEIGAGRYFEAPGPGELEMAFRTLDSLQSVQRRVQLEVETVPFHREIILAGFILILVRVVIRNGFLGEVP